MAKKKTTAKKAPKTKKPPVEVTDPVERVRATHPEGSDKTAFPNVEKR